MTRTRVYLAVSGDAPETLSRGDHLDPSAFTAHAVTSALRGALPQADEEDLEYEALWEAAARCPGRVLVAVVDLPDTCVTWGGDDEHPSAVECTTFVRAADLVSWHVALDGDVEDAELSWYDSSETAEVARIAAT